MRWGVGTGAARLVSGHMTVHRRLEERLAEFHDAERCVLFPSGTQAAAGVLGALAGPDHVIFCDAANHPAMADACRLSDAETLVYDHADLEHLAFGLEEARGRPAVVVTDAVFALEGDVAPLEGLAELARPHGALLVVNESLGLGALGPGGRGAVAEAGVEEEVGVVLGTLGKALGASGGYACGDRAIDAPLIAGARPLAHATAPAPPRGGRCPGRPRAPAPRARARAAPGRERARPARGARRRGALVGSVVHARPRARPPPAARPRSARRSSRWRAGCSSRRSRSGADGPGGPALRLAAMSSHTRRELRAAAGVLTAALGRRSAPSGPWGLRRPGRGRVAERQAVP